VGAACRAGIVMAVVIGVLWPTPAVAGRAEELVRQADQLQGSPTPSDGSLQRAIALYEEAARLEPNAAEIHVKLADAALTMGTWTTGDRQHWYGRGRQAAERAVALDKENPEALFLLAANIGQMAALQKDLGGLLVPRELERHLTRVLALNPRHPRALHMMGMLLRKTPAPLRVSLSGKASEAEKYLIAATEADPNFSEARLDLAQYYVSEGRLPQARAQAQAIVKMTSPTRPRAWREKHRPAAEALLKQLPAE
jgi:tetratricopeptide (TPR) repeat protein